MNTDTTRIIAKRIILTGHPFKVHKKTATVRYMFFNSGTQGIMCIRIMTVIDCISSQTTLRISRRYNYIRNTVAQDTYANPLARMGTSKHISMVPLIRWTPSVCHYTSASTPNGRLCWNRRNPLRKMRMLWRSECCHRNFTQDCMITNVVSSELSAPLSLFSST